MNLDTTFGGERGKGKGNGNVANALTPTAERADTPVCAKMRTDWVSIPFQWCREVCL